jgi:colanic acid/amylovoran biosynthesis glycosyltransferase
VQSLNFLRYGRASLSLRLFYSAIQVPRQVRYDIIHGQFGFLGPTALSLRDSGAIYGKLVTSFRGYDIATLTGRKAGSYRKLFREGDLFLPVSRYFAQILLERGCDERKIMVHHSGIDCGAFSFRVRTRLDGEPTKLITIGRLVEKKGVAYAVRAVARLIEAGRQVRYTVVVDGEMRTELEKLVSALRMDPHVRLVGWNNQDGVIRFLEDAHLLLAPSVTAANGDLEGIPNSLKEAMAMGLPVVSTLHAGIPELVQDGRSGFLVPERDVDALADRLAFLIDHPDRWAEMGRFGRQQIREHFDTDKLNDQLVEAYLQLVPSGEL